jgi:hypothetical protein
VRKVPDYGLYDRVLIHVCAGSKAQSVSYPMAIKDFFLRVKLANDFDPVTELRMYRALLSLPHISSYHVLILVYLCNLIAIEMFSEQ